MLGTALQRVLTERGAVFSAPGEGEFDITDPVAVRHRVADFAAGLAPGTRGVLLNAAAYTNVEAAEENAELAYLVNSHGPALLAREAREQGLTFVHVSTDFVFDGRKQGAYTETDDTNPLSVYGASKLAGELAVEQEYPDAIIARTAWVFGPGGVNFPVKIVAAARTRPSLSVVTDEVGSPTYTLDLAAGLLGLVDAGASGLYHLAGSGSCSRFELAGATLALAGLGDGHARAGHERCVSHEGGAAAELGAGLLQGGRARRHHARVARRACAVRGVGRAGGLDRPSRRDEVG